MTGLTVDDALLFGATALVNLALAALVAGVRPSRPGNGLLAAALALNGAYSAFLVPGFLGVSVFDRLGRAGVDGLVGFTLSLSALVPLTVLPFVVPRRRLSRRAQRIGLVAAGALVLYIGPFLGTARQLGYLGWEALPAAWRVSDLFILGSAVVGVVLALDSYVDPRGPIERRVAAVLLVAFALRLAAGGTYAHLIAFALAPPGISPLAFAFSGPIGFSSSAIYAVMWVAALAIPAALLVSRLRGNAGSRSVGLDALLSAAVPAGLVLTWLLRGVGKEFMEFLLVRPLLLTFAILQFQMLAVDVRRREPLLVAALLPALLAVFLLTQSIAARVAPGSATGIALVVAVGIGSLLAVPLLRIVLLPGEADEPRRLLVYRAALEAASREAPSSSGPMLKALRRELGISDKDHALLVASAEATGTGAALAPGLLFLDRYRIVRPLGRGGTGEVVLAKDERLQRLVAIKRLAGHVRRDARALRAFEREIRLAGALQHSHIVAIHDVESVGEDAFLVMEYAPGGSLQEKIERDGKLSETDARQIMRDVLGALGALHARGIVHRDVKPANILLDAHGRAKLADFTVARDAVSGDTVGGASGEPVGSWLYMSPEQARGLPATERSDIYGAGATLYAALSGAPPIRLDGETEQGARMRIAREEPGLPLPGLPASVNAALARALAKDPRERYASADEMAQALAR